MRDWLHRELQSAHMDIAAAYLFGSSIKPGQNPRDVDLVIVTVDGAGEPGWQRIIAYRDILKERFRETFQLPLSALVLTPSEWSELDGTIVRERVPIFFD